MPPGGDGFYYFSVYLYVQLGGYGRFDIQINGDVLCMAQGDQHQASGDDAQAVCSTAVYGLEGLCALFFCTGIKHQHESILFFIANIELSFI